MPANAQVSRELTLAAALDGARLGFRAEAGRFVGGLGAHQVEVRPDGAFTLRPAHFPKHGRPRHGAPFAVETTAIARGSLVAAAGAAKIAGDGSIEIARGFAVEKLRSTAQGLEQSWTFAARPDGEGDLQVRVQTSGHAFLKATATGLHFADAASGLGVRYGVATLIDARGARTRIEPRFEGGQIVLVVPAGVLDGAAYPAVLDPTLSGEITVDAGTTINSEIDAHVVYGNGNFLVTWYDSGNIRGAIVSRTGTVAVPAFTIGTNSLGAATGAYDPVGTSYLVLWQDSLTPDVARCARVNAATGVAGSPFALINSAAGLYDFEPTIAPNGEGMIVYSSPGTGVASVNDFAVVLPQGSTTPGAPIEVVGDNIASNWTPSVSVVVSGGVNTYLVTWLVYNSPTGGLFSRTVSASGTLGTAHRLSSPGNIDWGFDSASNGTNQFVIGFAATSQGEVRATLTDATGTPQLALDGTQLFTNINETTPSLAWDGTNYVLSWADDSTDVYGTLLTPAGTQVWGPTIVKSGSAFATPGLASDGAGVALFGYQSGNGIGATLLNESAAAGSTCVNPTDCASGSCLGGICCASPCPSVPGTTFSCTAGSGTCAVASCAPGFGDCDGLAANGCEDNTTNDPLNCGSCGNVCPPLANASPGCALSTCGIASCNTGFANCDSSTASGCETAINAIPNCGGCGISCAEVGPNDCTKDSCVGSPVGACNHYDWGNCAEPGRVGVCGLQAACRHDTDGDGLSDEWESNGGIDVNCDGTYSPAEKVLTNVDPGNPLGASASVTTQDIFLEYDYMVLPDQGTACTPNPIPGYPGNSNNCDFDQVCIGGICRGHSDAPDPTAVAMVVQKLRDHGINLHIDPVHQALPHARVISYGPPVVGCAAPDAATLGQARRAVDFYSYKSNPAFYDKAHRQGAYHYVIFGHEHTCDSTTDCASAACASSGNPDWRSSGTSEYVGDDVIVAYGGRWDQTGGAAPATIVNQAATLLHELGHNLGLDHGGPYDGSAERGINFKPNYVSVMNYAYQLTGITTADRPNRTNCTSDHTDTGTIVACPVRIDFQDVVPDPLNPSGVFHNLDELAGLDETKGVNAGSNDIVYWYCPGRHTGPGVGPIDFDCNNDGAIEAPTPPRVEISNDGTYELLQSHRDWPSLQLSFQCNPLTNGDGAAPLSARSVEISWEKAAQDGLIYPPVTENMTIRPGCATHWIAPGQAGIVQAVVYASADFNPAKVKGSSVKLLGSPALLTLLNDVNGDGAKDLVATFWMGAMSAKPSATQATLTGQLESSQIFQAIAPITVVSSTGPVLTKTADANGYSGTLTGTPNGQYEAHSLAECISKAVDRCGAGLPLATSAQIDKITTDENDPDAARITGRTTFAIERERDLAGNGRVYTVYYHVSDLDGVSAGSCKLEVRRTSSPAVDSGPKVCVGDCR
jgi:hypothetical protein